MRSFKEVKAHYNLTPEDERLLATLQPYMAEHAQSIMEDLRAWMLQTRETSRFFEDEERRKRVFAGHERWFADLFGGKYDTSYYERLIRIGQTHVRASVDAHYMNRAINIVRSSCICLINRAYDDTDERCRMILALEKILDINLDIITSSYIEEEMRTYSPSFRVRSTLLAFSEHFIQSMNFVLMLALMGLTIGVVGLFVYDLHKAFTSNVSHAVITALGSLLVLWVMIELMNTEIKHLKGGKFRISVFVGVALVAFIRDTMIMALKHEESPMMYYFIGLILTLGIVFWLVTRAEDRSV